MTLRKCCACHEICTRPHQNVAPATQCNPCETSALPCQWSRRRARSETAPSPLRPDGADRLAFASPETPIHAQRHAFCDFLISENADSRTGPCFCDFLFPCHTRAHVSSWAYSFSCHLSERASFQLVAVTRKFLLNFL